MSEAVSIETLEMILNEQAANNENLRLDGDLIINRDMLEQIKDLHKKKRDLIGSAPQSMAGSAGVDTSEVDAEIDAKIAEADKFIVKIHFRAVSNDEYLRVVKRHPDAKNNYDDANVAEWNDFLGDLAEACYTGSTWRGQTFPKEQWPLAKWKADPVVGFGQLKPIFDEVLNLNQETPDRSFLSKPSKPSPTI